MGRDSAEDINNQNIQNQREFATNALTWKAGDARRAEAAYGINPLALLGAQTSSFQNVVGDNSLGQGIAAAGQDLGRAANALTDHQERKAQLDEDLVKAQIANINSQTVQNQAAASNMATRVTSATPGLRPGMKSKTLPLYSTYVDPDGNKVLLPSDKASSSLQNMASWPSNAAIGLDLFSRNLGVRHMWRDTNDWVVRHGSVPIRGDVYRNGMPMYQPGG